MARQFKNARLIKHLKVSDAMKLLGVSQPTLSAWEGEHKSPSIDKLEMMADVYETSTEYLLGRTELLSPVTFNPVPAKNLLILHGKPVWSPTLGWLLVNSIEQHLVQADGTTIPFTEAGELYMTPPAFSELAAPQEEPLTLDDILLKKDIWVEPISNDSILRDELRGWYHRKERFVENEYGSRIHFIFLFNLLYFRSQFFSIKL